MVKVYLDPGHGGSDPGATGNGLREKDLVLKIARYTRNYLQNDYSGVSVRMSRNDDSFPSLTDRTNDANSWGADIFVSIHINAFNGSAHGYEDFIFNGNVRNDTGRLRDSLHAELAPLFRNNRGKKRANFAVLRQSNMPAVLTENGFIDNKQDADYLSKDSNLKKIAQAHAKGIASYFGLSKGSSGDSGGGNAKSPSKSKGANLTVDGKWGGATTGALQVALGTTVDDIISNQRRNSVTEAMYGNTVRFSSSGNSMVIRALQELVGATVDGLLGPQTVRLLQEYLGTIVDGVLSRPSMVVEEMQCRLNAGTF
ncbi:N-acetylmuramoyl-L-alanine amidase [Virgibacillus oceani]